MTLTLPSSHYLNPRSNQNISGYDWDDGFIFFKDWKDQGNISADSRFAFGADSVESGELFRFAAETFGEEAMAQKHLDLKRLYLNDPLYPTAKPYSRPPIRHVFMVYGTNARTEIGSAYTLPESGQLNPPREEWESSVHSTKGPRLEEILVEEPCPPCRTGSGSGSGSSSPVSSGADAAWCDGQEAKEGLEKGSFDIESHVVAESLAGEGLGLEELPPAWVSRAPSGPQAHRELNSLKEEGRMEPCSGATGKERRGKGDVVKENGSDCPVAAHSSEMSGKDRAIYERVLSRHVTGRRDSEGVADICVYALKSKEKGMSRKPEKRFVRRKLGQPASGDGTVPFVSLAYAHSWLKEGLGGEGEDLKYREEHQPHKVHRHKLDEWYPRPVASKMASVQPAVNLYEMRNIRSKRSTTILELDGCDHINILKLDFVHELVFKNLMGKVGTELRLAKDDQCAASEGWDENKRLEEGRVEPLHDENGVDFDQEHVNEDEFKQQHSR